VEHQEVVEVQVDLVPEDQEEEEEIDLISIIIQTFYE
jgi:hypothetical protein